MSYRVSQKDLVRLLGSLSGGGAGGYGSFGGGAGGYGSFASYDPIMKNAENIVKDIFETHPFIQISQGTEKEKHLCTACFRKCTFTVAHEGFDPMCIHEYELMANGRGYKCVTCCRTILEELSNNFLFGSQRGMACERVVMSKSELIDKNVAILQLLSKKLTEHRRLGHLSVNFRLSEDEVDVLGKFGKHLVTKIGLCWDEGFDGRVRIQGNSANILPCLQEINGAAHELTVHASRAIFPAYMKGSAQKAYRTIHRKFAGPGVELPEVEVKRRLQDVQKFRQVVMHNRIYSKAADAFPNKEVLAKLLAIGYPRDLVFTVMWRYFEHVAQDPQTYNADWLLQKCADSLSMSFERVIEVNPTIATLFCDDDDELLQSVPTREEGQLAALANSGGTCYINCILQCYFSIPALRQMVLLLDVEALESTKNFDMGKIKALAEMKRLFAKMECSIRSVLDASAFNNLIRDALSFRRGEHQDVAEFHSQLLELLSDAFAKCSSAKPKSPKHRQKMSDAMITLTTELQVASELGDKDEIERLRKAIRTLKETEANGTSSRLGVLREELKLAVKKREASENEYRTFATEECDVGKDFIDAKIEKARSEPQHNPRLQAIHVAHEAVLAKEIDIKAAEKEEENSEDEDSFFNLFSGLFSGTVQEECMTKSHQRELSTKACRTIGIPLNAFAASKPSETQVVASSPGPPPLPTLKRQVSAVESTDGFYKDKNLYTAMDKMLQWQDTPDHQSVLKHRTSCWPVLPPVLVFNLMRAKKDYKVDHSKFSFDETVFMDPYTAQHRKQWLTDQNLQALRDNLADKLNDMERHQQSLKTLHVKEVVGTLRAEALLLSGEASERVDAAADTLMQVHKDLETRLRNTTDKVLECRQKIAEYFSSRSRYRYQLRAVVVHRGGSANSGHYYCYVRHGDGWARCDDETVETGLSVADMLKNAAGNNNESASFLIYTDDHGVEVKMAGAVMASDGKICIDQRLVDTIERDNDKLRSCRNPSKPEAPVSDAEAEPVPLPEPSMPPATAQETDHLQTLEALGLKLTLQAYREGMAQSDGDFEALANSLMPF